MLEEKKEDEQLPCGITSEEKKRGLKRLLLSFFS